MSDLSTDPVSPVAIVLGAEPFPITFLDGRTGTVSIRLLAEPEVDYPAFLRAVDDDRLLAEFVAKQEPGWAASLHPASLMDVCERALALNFPLVRRWAELRTRKLGLLDALGGILPAGYRSPKP